VQLNTKIDTQFKKEDINYKFVINKGLMISGLSHLNKKITIEKSDLNEYYLEEIDFQNDLVCLRYKGRKIQCRILKKDIDTQTYHIKINGDLVEFNLSRPVDDVIKKIGLSNQQQQAANSLKAPMPGLILEICVKEGDEVKKDQSLIILEAMKMENVLAAPIDGKIKEIKVSPQETVEKNSLLITFDI
jgi:biotin carboxyl carrier protein